MIAALYVERGGVYWNLPGVDPWDEERDALLYAGPHPVVAHPPCARWSRLAGFTEARFGLNKGLTSITPPEFRDVLIAMARSSGIST